MTCVTIDYIIVAPADGDILNTILDRYVLKHSVLTGLNNLNRVFTTYSYQCFRITLELGEKVSPT